MDLSSAPTEIEEFTTWMLKNGATIAETVHRQDSSNQLIEFSYPDALMIRITADRGQWSVELGKIAWGDSFDGDIWDACLAGKTVAMQPSPLSRQLLWFKENWLTISSPEREVQLDCLVRNRKTRAFARLGLSLS